VVERGCAPCRARRRPGQRATALGVGPGLEAFVGVADDEPFNERLRAHASAGRPLGADRFVESLERLPARSLKRKKPGPKTRERDIYTGDLFRET
jgi:hypothetical protein